MADEENLNINDENLDTDDWVLIVCVSCVGLLIVSLVFWFLYDTFTKQGKGKYPDLGINMKAGSPLPS